MNFRNVHIGNLIAEQIKQVGITKAEFGRRINTSRQNVNTLLAKSSIPTELLVKISEVLDYDFFAHYQVEEKVSTVESRPLVEMHVVIRGDREWDSFQRWMEHENMAHLIPSQTSSSHLMPIS